MDLSPMDFRRNLCHSVAIMRCGCAVKYSGNTILPGLPVLPNP